jgi:hypothetical protein
MILPRTMKRRQQAFRPSPERLEARDLPSSVPVVSSSAARDHTPRVSLNLVRESTDPTGSARTRGHGAPVTRGQQTATPAWVNESFLQSLVSQIHGPLTTTQSIQVGSNVFPPGTYQTPQPTPAEVRREIFWTTFRGSYFVGPPRFSNQSASIHLYSDGNSTFSNQFLKGRSQIILFPPADPTAQPTTLDPVAGQTTGLMSLFLSNFLQSGDTLFLDLTTQVNYAGGPSFPGLPNIPSNDPSALDHGLPSKVYFLLDTGGAGLYTTPAYTTTPAVQRVFNSATGTYSTPLPVQASAAGAVGYATNDFVGQGVGIVNITYFPGPHPPGRPARSGKVVVRLQGLINMPGGVLNAISRSIN